MVPFAPLFLKALMITTSTVNRLTTDNNLVRLNHGGLVRGTVLLSEEGRPFYAFKGIPYAEPPVGDLRLRAPVPKQTWMEEFDATKEGPECPQVDLFLRQGVFSGQEDCLTINVYTPQLPQKDKQTRKRDVLVYIHGGGFVIGSGTSFFAPPERLMDTGNVLVTMNYRLESLGFLSTGDEASPGNYGLLDQSLALQWVKDNIEIFGGNAGSVSIFGHSAGAASVSYQLISPLSKGLFHRAMPLSGSSLCPWAFIPDPLRWAKHLASHTGCPEEPTSAMVDCFRTKTVQELVKGMLFYSNFGSFPIPFAPTVDGHFLLEVPSFFHRQNLNKVPVLTGITEEEGAGFVTWFKMAKPNTSVTSDELTDYAVNSSLSGQYADIMDDIKKQYFGSADRNDEEQYTKTLVKLLSDGTFRMDHYLEVKMLAMEKVPVYVYSFDFRADRRSPIFQMPIKYGVNHGEDMFMTFDVDFLGKVYLTQRDRRMSKLILEIISNFARTGNPDPTHQYHPIWKPSTEERIHILRLNDTLTSQDYSVDSNENQAFWTSVRDRIYERKFGETSKNL